MSTLPRPLIVLLSLTCVVILASALSAAQAVVAPIVFAMFAIALIWPLQGALQRRIPAVAALLITMLVTLVTLLGLAWLVAWAFGRVGAHVVANAAQLQAFYTAQLAWAEARGIDVAGTFAAQFDARWLVRLAQSVLAQLRGTLSFILLTLVFVLLGLLEVGAVRSQMLVLRHTTPTALLRAAERIGAKLRAYMLVRTLVSVVTGLVVWAFASIMGLELAAEWGAIALVLNYIPFLGPLVATLFPTLFAALQFGSWGSALMVFAGLQVLQFLGGSYIEPRLAGRNLAVSPFLVLASVFIGGFLWGVPGAFIGPPALIAALTLCEEFLAARPFAALLSGQEARD
ncbi:MAG: AI-2E family transporter [Roseomonas sp.]|nr:AI-2E family transporter [Roseomonas sp.]MCA3393668.1 AI-2E family transporter [Roseomonas sp.]MCA3409210.1 AI-2E family transporter [Roseomonas sp.]